MTFVCGAVIATAVVATPDSHAAPQAAAQKAPAIGAVQALEARYAARLEALKAEISNAIPAVDEGKKAACAAAREAEKAAKAALDAAHVKAGELQQAQALVAHAEGKWIGGAEKGIAAAKEKLAKAATDAGRKAAQEQLAKEQQGLKAGQEALVVKRDARASRQTSSGIERFSFLRDHCNYIS